MQKAIHLAYQARGFTKSNPLVGCVIVDQDNKLLSWGHHPYFGGPHAEVVALNSLTEKKEKSLKNATLYCTLEPCLSWEGKKTPSCLEKLLQTPISRIVLANRDPHAQVSGKATTRLEANGKKVEIGVLSKEAAWMNRSYIKWVTTGIPYIRLKFAQSLEGNLHPLPYQRMQLSCPQSQILVHHLRANSDAILIGGNTARIDQPKLNVRLNFYRKSPYFTQPKKIILSKSDFLNLDRTSLTQWLLGLGQQGISSILVEAGPFWQQQFLNKNLFDEVLIFVSPKFIGPGKGIILENPLDFVQEEGNFSAFDHHTWKKSGQDIVFQGISLKGNPCLQELLKT